jgi:3-hydroxyisobutyrate dehydrogenase
MSAASDVRSVALLGTGTMGAPMASNLVRAGFEVTVWNRTPERAAPLEAEGARLARSPREAVEGADALITMLADGPSIEAVLGGDDGALRAARPGAVWIQMSTVGVAAADRLAKLAADAGVAFVDAPVLGSRQPAVEGRLVVLGSGPEEQRERCAPIFEALGRRTLWVGPAGAGSRLKVVVNAWLMAMTATLGETIALAEALGVDPEWFFDATGRGEIAALYTDLLGSAMVAREFPVNFPLALATKDIGLALEAGSELQLSVFEGTREQFARAEELGHGASDWAAVIHGPLGVRAGSAQETESEGKGRAHA